MKGTLIGVGVGPGDPELMTLKAVRMIRENEVIAVPGKQPKETVAYQIAVQAAPELADKTLLPLYMPMTMDAEERENNWKIAAGTAEQQLEQGKNVIFLTLGDPTVYSTFSYVKKLVEEHGYQTATVSGITSFCAAAARMNVSLSEWNEPLHILPARHNLEDDLNYSGNCVLMKSGRKMDRVKQQLAQSGRDVVMVENCGMPEEKIYHGVEEIPDDAGYYSLIIAREPKHD